MMYEYPVFRARSMKRNRAREPESVRIYNSLTQELNNRFMATPQIEVRGRFAGGAMVRQPPTQRSPHQGAVVNLTGTLAGAQAFAALVVVACPGVFVSHGSLKASRQL